MAFSTTLKIVSTIPGLPVATVTLADTAGSSSAIDFGAVESITIQAVNVGTNGTTTVECSNDGTTWAGLPTAVTFTASGVKSIPADGLGFKRYRLTLAGGDATSSHTYTVVAANSHHARPA